MLEWISRLFQSSAAASRKHFFGMVDSLNAEAAGGKPAIRQQHLGHLKLRSRKLVIGDPSYLPTEEVPNIFADEISISASLWQYPSGTAKVIGLKIELGNGAAADEWRKIGEVGIDSARIVVADKADIDEHWADEGPDRIGVISTAPDDKAMKALTKRFKLKTVQINPVRADVVGQVSKALEQEIDAYLNSIPEYAGSAFMYFRVDTNNSFERVNYMKKAWDFLPIGNSESPQMFACGTGRGDGVYELQCGFNQDSARVLLISFVDEAELSNG